MKKLLLLCLAISIGICTWAQNEFVPRSSVTSQTKLIKPKKVIIGNEINSKSNSSSNTVQANMNGNGSYQQTGTETILGVTTYDLQSNSAMATRIKNNGDGTLMAVWTYSEAGNVGAPDRGTGYNFFNGTSWGPAPTSRIESQRVGWPNIMTTISGDEIILCHNTQMQVITMDKRSTIGSGTWTSTNINTDYQIWHRSTVGGSNGMSIHDISLRDPDNPINSVTGHMFYYRSLDGGISWEKQNAIIPGLDNTKFINMSGDAYSITSQGDMIAIAYWGIFDDILLVKSMDNGDTWATTIVKDFPIDKYDVDVTAVLDTTETSDETGAILIDANGIVHMWYSEFILLDDNLGDGFFTSFPLVNGLMYWNETMGDDEPVSIASIVDINTNGTLDIVDQGTISDYRYSSLISWPSAGIDTNGCMYVSYSGIREDLDQGTQNYRHMYVVRSCDGGCTWSFPMDVTDLPGGGNNFAECVFGSMAELVDDNVHIVYQRDFEPGIAVAGDMDLFGSNDIVYLSVPVTDFDTIPAGVCFAKLSGDTLFCAGDSVLLTSNCGNSWLWSTGETTQSIYYKGAFGAVTCAITTDCGVLNESIMVSAPSTPPMVTVASTTLEMCNGDSAWITATSNAGGTFLWTPGGATTMSIATDSAGTYDVAVTNCGGSTNASVTILEPVVPPTFTLSATQTIMCSGDTSVLSVSSVSQGTYIWSTGDTAQTTTVTDTGTYTVIVSNCGGADTSSVTISIPSAPTATITGNDPFCYGDTITLMAGTEPSATYVWSNGDSTQSTMVDTTTLITLSVTNCGGTSNVSVTPSFVPIPTVNVSANPSTTFCDDGGVTTVSLTAFAFGSPPYTYAWSNADTTQAITLGATAETGTYNVTVSNMCGESVTSDTTSVTIHTPLVVDTTSIVDASSTGASDGAINTAVTSGTSPYTYAWSPGGSTDPSPSGLASGTYDLSLTDANGCVTTLSATVGEPVGISELEFGSFNIHPNPNNGEFTVELVNLGNDEYNIVVRNIIGQIVFSETVIGNTIDKIDVNLTDQENGVYLLTISNSNGIRTEKLIVH